MSTADKKRILICTILTGSQTTSCQHFRVKDSGGKVEIFLAVRMRQSLLYMSLYGGLSVLLMLCKAITRIRYKKLHVCIQANKFCQNACLFCLKRHLRFYTHRSFVKLCCSYIKYSCSSLNFNSFLQRFYALHL